MRTRIIDGKSIDPAMNNPDATWERYANTLTTAFGDLDRKSDKSGLFFDVAYCEQRVRNLDNNILQSLFYNLPPACFEDKVWLENFSKESDDLNTYEVLSQWKPNDHAPFFILGHVGTGKSTFICNFIRCVEKDHQNQFLCLRIDFINFSPGGNILKTEIMRNIELALREKTEYGSMTREMILDIYKEEVKRKIKLFPDNEKMCRDEIDRLISRADKNYSEKVYSEDKINFIADFLRFHQDTHKCKVWLIFDNIDQVSFVPDISLFMIIREMISFLECDYIMCLRYVTMKTLSESNYYGAFQTRRIKLSLPNIALLIEKRIDLFKVIAENESILLNKLKWSGNRDSMLDNYGSPAIFVAHVGKTG
jgi:hypothetical protein